MLQLGCIFQSGAVFQQKKIIPVWGKTDPDTIIEGIFAGEKIYCKSSSSGDFMLYFPPVNAGGPYTLQVSDVEGREKIVLDDILVGEVWIASGQSNMAYNLQCKHPHQFGSEVAEAQEKEFYSLLKDRTDIRFITVELNAGYASENTFKGEWKYMDIENAGLCSAVGAWFGHFVQEKLDVPIGLIVSAWGGTIVEAWTSRGGLHSNPDTVPMINEWDNVRAKYVSSTFLKQAPSIGVMQDYADPGNTGFGDGFANVDFDDSAWNNFVVPGSWIKQRIAGNGALWARFSIELSAEDAKHDFVLKMGAIDKTDITYVNGVEIGRSGEGFDTGYYNKPRKYNVPAGILRPGKNVIAVRAYSFFYDGAFTGIRDEYVFERADGKVRIAASGIWRAYPEVDFGLSSVARQIYGAGNPNTPSILFDSMIHPLIPYAIAGVIWYQGESNTLSTIESRQYLRKIETMIRDWRYHWGQGDFPFIQVQLANYYGEDYPINEKSNWAPLRESQLLVCDKLPNVGMVTIIDAGEVSDIHPQDKKVVGERLAAYALNNVYFRKDIVPEGPHYRGYRIENNKVRTFFDFSDGMEMRAGKPMSFVVAGVDRIFFPADTVEIEGNTVLVGSTAVSEPVAVRYAWGDNPSSSLYNAAGFPASPFRTDDWELLF